MTVINTIEYRLYPSHGRFMIEEYLNGEYDHCNRAVNADVSYIVGDAFPSDLALGATYVLTQTIDGFTLATFHGAEKVREEVIKESKVHHFFETRPVIPIRIRTVGEDVETNYEYRICTASE